MNSRDEFVIAVIITLPRCGPHYSDFSFIHHVDGQGLKSGRQPWLNEPRKRRFKKNTGIIHPRNGEHDQARLGILVMKKKEGSCVFSELSIMDCVASLAPLSSRLWTCRHDLTILSFIAKDNMTQLCVVVGAGPGLGSSIATLFAKNNYKVPLRPSLLRHFLSSLGSYDWINFLIFRLRLWVEMKKPPLKPSKSLRAMEERQNSMLATWQRTRSSSR